MCSGCLGPHDPTSLMTWVLIRLVAALLSAAPMALAASARPVPKSPASHPQVFDPDPQTCQAETMRSAFARQLAPYADQGEQVLRQLRAVQAEITLASLRSCVRRGLMAEEEAVRLGRDFGIIAPTAQTRGSSRPTTNSPSTRP